MTASRLLPVGLYHVTFSASDRSSLFASSGAANRLLELLAEFAECAALRVHSVCVIHGRAEAMLASYVVPLNVVLESIAETYSELCAVPLAFKAQRLQSTADVLNTARAIHMMPVYAGLAEHPAEHDFTSYRAFATGEKFPGLYKDMVLGIFGSVLDRLGDEIEKSLLFRAFVTRDLLPPYDELERRREGEPEAVLLPGAIPRRFFG